MLISDRLFVHAAPPPQEREAAGSTLAPAQWRDVRDEAKAKVEEHHFDRRHRAPDRRERAAEGARR